MKLGAPYVLNGFACLLLASVVAAACGSDADRLRARDGGGAGGEGGDRRLPAAGGGETEPQPLGGNGGELPVPSGGVGGEPIGVAGTPQTTLGGEGGTTGGIGGEGGAGLPPVDCDPIVFDDPMLEQAVRNALDKSEGDITSADVIELTTLQANGYGIAELGGIECLSSLVTAHFGVGGGPNSVSDLRPLRYLRDLQLIDLSNCPLDDLAPLAQLPNLEALILTRSLQDGESLAGLADAPSLVQIELQNNELGDLSGLGQIATLELVDLRASTLNDPASIGELTQIKQLRASSTLSDATPLGALTQLETLELGDKIVANLNALAPLVNLTHLDLQSTGATSVAFALNMTKLQILNLYVNQVSDLTPLQNLPALNIVSLNNNPIASLSPLANNLGLTTGDIVNLTAVTLNCPNEANNLKALKDRGVTIYGSACP